MGELGNLARRERRNRWREALRTQRDAQLMAQDFDAEIARLQRARAQLLAECERTLQRLGYRRRMHAVTLLGRVAGAARQWWPRLRVRAG